MGSGSRSSRGLSIKSSGLSFTGEDRVGEAGYSHGRGDRFSSFRADYGVGRDRSLRGAQSSSGGGGPVCGSQAGGQLADSGSLTLVGDYGFADVVRPEVLVVPGGPGTRALVEDHELLEWIRSVHETTRWTTSVCTGALLLAAAGVLDGLRATTHWRALELLASYDVEAVSERIVEQGKVITAAGVSAGIDMALRLADRLAGAEIAQAIQLIIEYAPEPPFDAGSPDRVSSEIVSLAGTLA